MHLNISALVSTRVAYGRHSSTCTFVSYFVFSLFLVKQLLIKFPHKIKSLLVLAL